MQVPLIDSGSTSGIVPDKINPSIEFKDVCFSYPANPQVQVLTANAQSVVRILFSIRF